MCDRGRYGESDVGSCKKHGCWTEERTRFKEGDIDIVKSMSPTMLLEVPKSAQSRARGPKFQESFVLLSSGVLVFHFCISKILKILDLVERICSPGPWTYVWELWIKHSEKTLIW